jgi:hypothetical protein
VENVPIELTYVGQVRVGESVAAAVRSR